MSSNPEALAAALKKFASTATVEAEYGDVVVAGNALTLPTTGRGRPTRPPAAG
jgi:hypothetical protein